MNYKIIGDVNISGKKIGDIVEAEPHAMEIYLQRGQVELINEKATTEPVEETPVELSENEQIKKELTEKGIEFKGNASTKSLKELNV